MGAGKKKKVSDVRTCKVWYLIEIQHQKKKVVFSYWLNFAKVNVNAKCYIQFFYDLLISFNLILLKKKKTLQYSMNAKY